ncbi:MAG: hypothetical protein ABUL77_00890 [Bacteroidota bacterium]
MADRHYLHGDYLEATDRNATSSVYCGICDGYCLPQHLYDEHDIDLSVQRLKATKKVFYRVKRDGGRPENAPNYFDGSADTP